MKMNSKKLILRLFTVSKKNSRENKKPQNVVVLKEQM